MVFLIIFRNNILLNFWKVKYRSDKDNFLDRNKYFNLGFAEIGILKIS